MTRLAATNDKIAQWARVSSQEIEETQTLAELPDDVRKFPFLSPAEIEDLTGTSKWLWRDYVRSLPEDEKPEVSSGGHYRTTLAQVHHYMDVTGIRPRRPEGIPRAMRVAVENFKGGAGKSSTTLHLAVALARKGYRILLIDSDPQATLSHMLGIRTAKIRASETIAAAVGIDGPEGQLFPTDLSPRPTYISGLSIIPSSLELTKLEFEVLQRYRQEEDIKWLAGVFDEALAKIDMDYDLVFVDFQPAFSMTQILLLLAMDALVIPMPTEAADFAGTSDFLYQISQIMAPMASITGVHKTWDPTLVVHTRMRKGTELVHSIAGNTFGAHRLLEYVDDQPAISAALSTFRSVFEVGSKEYDRRGIKRAQEQYNRLADAVLDSIKARWEEMLKEHSHVEKA